MRFLIVWIAVAGAGMLQESGRLASREEQLARYRNLGKAFYENPTTKKEAVEEFRKALELAPSSVRERVNYGLALLSVGEFDSAIVQLQKAQRQDPSLPYTWFNLAVAFKQQNKPLLAIQQFEQMAKLVPDEPVTRYNLGLLYRQRGESRAAMDEFEAAARLDSNLVAPRYQMFMMFRESGRKAEAEAAFRDFRMVKARQVGPDASQEDVNWCYYSEIYDPSDARPEKRQAKISPEFAARILTGRADAGSAHLMAVDFDSDGKPDLLIWSNSGVLLYRGGTEQLDAGLNGLRRVTSVAAGDFNNDGWIDLCVIAGGVPLLFENDHGVFKKRDLPASGNFTLAVWLDYDHDYDLDLMLLGPQPVLLRNQGKAGWADHSKDFPFERAEPVGAIAFRLTPDTKTMDLLVTYRDKGSVLYRDRLNGRYEATPASGVPTGARDLTIVDIDNDGWLDIAFRSGGTAGALRNRSGVLSPLHLPACAKPFVFADTVNSGYQDLICAPTVAWNLGENRFEKDSLARVPESAALAAADFNGDGRVDVAFVNAQGSPGLLENQSRKTGSWLAVSLEGVKNLKCPTGAEIELKAGTSYQKKLYQTAPVLFGLGGRQEADAIRITWPSGFVQNETSSPGGRRIAIKESPRLSGSCPMIFTWNGRQFQFVTDVLGVAPLGASSGDGSYFPVDHDEYIQIPAGALTPDGGKYHVRITEELNEVSYLDQVRLMAIDHPSRIEIFTNDKWKSPPYPEFRLFGVERRIYPSGARDEGEHDVLDRLLLRDRRYVDGFPRDYAGVAGMHALTLSFPPGTASNQRAVLVLNGWVDWADGSTFLAASQGGRNPLNPPYLQMKDSHGRWQTVIADMGMPSGKTKTIAVDLTGKFLSSSREMRIVTNMCVYWDEIFLSDDSRAPVVHQTAIDAAKADVHFRGFSQVTLHPERKQPEYFDYSRVSAASNWNQTPGLYTRYGDVTELVRAADDRMVIMGSGDELKLEFDASGLPALPDSWTRDFLLLVDGWAKDSDANTAYSQSVGPLPFHRMTSYPYPPAECFPDDQAHRLYLARYNTRQALRPLRPLRAAARGVR